MDEKIENIDIGGPTMIRAAAKNFKWVSVVVSPKDYRSVGAAISNGGLTEKSVLALLKKPLVIVLNMIKPSLKHCQKKHPNMILCVMVKTLTNKLLL